MVFNLTFIYIFVFDIKAILFVKIVLLFLYKIFTKNSVYKQMTEEISKIETLLGLKMETRTIQNVPHYILDLSREDYMKVYYALDCNLVSTVMTYMGHGFYLTKIDEDILGYSLETKEHIVLNINDNLKPIESESYFC